ncbi:DUF3368 domain-containing protein [Myxococcota bacterium]|nr:DUF3368 domain-containing protein [Myxococcota bacterium]
MDERRGRQVAKRCNLNVIGVLGILIEAKHKGFVPLAKPLLDELVQRSGFRLSSELYDTFLNLVQEG